MKPLLERQRLILHPLREGFPVDTGRKLNVHQTFRRRPGRLLNVLCTFSLRPVSIGLQVYIKFIETSLKNNCPVDTRRKLNIHKTFRRCPGRLLNVLNTFNLCLVSAGWSFCDHFSETTISQTDNRQFSDLNFYKPY